jgi:hypothetical protein
MLVGSLYLLWARWPMKLETPKHDFGLYAKQGRMNNEIDISGNTCLLMSMG